jgi:hypothetical protein
MTTDPNALETETPSGEVVPNEAGTPPGEELEETPGSPDPDEPQEETEDEPEPTAAEETAFAKLRAKYPNMSDDEFHETVADNYWKSTKEISSRGKRIQELEAALREAEAAQPEAQEEPEEPQPNPQLERLEGRMKQLYDRGQQFQTEQQELLVELPKLDREIAKAEAREEDAAAKMTGDDFDSKAETARDKWAAKKAGLESDKRALIRQIRDLHHKREQADFEMETLLADKDWMTRVAQQQQEQQQVEKQNLQKFNQDFPQFVDRLIGETADKLGAPKDDKIRQSLWKHVNRATTMDFWSMAQKGLDKVDVPKLIEGHVKEYLEDRELVGRVKFKAKSEAKLKVAGRPQVAPAPGAIKPPVPVTQMGSSGRTPAMEAARKHLAKRNL